MVWKVDGGETAGSPPHWASVGAKLSKVLDEGRNGGLGTR